MKCYPLYLNGEWVKGETRLPVRNPATEEPFAAVSTVTRERVRQALSDGQAAFLNWRQQSGKTRGEGRGLCQ